MGWSTLGYDKVGGMTKVVRWVLPGLPQLLQGRWLGGGTALFLWIALVGLTLARLPRVAGTLSAGVEGWVALLTIITVLSGVWMWSFRRNGGDRLVGPGVDGAAGGLWAGFRENRMAVVGLWVVGAFYLAALLAPILSPFDPAYQPAYQDGQMELILAPPSVTHILGTDQFSRDIFSRILFGARISLSIGLLAVGISVTFGAVLGAVAGYLGGWIDAVVMRFVDMVMAFPRLVLLIGLVAFFPRSILLIILALAFTQWPFTTRIVRGEVLGLREREFAEAARALGFSKARIIFRHLLPNTLAPIIVAATLGIGNTIILEAGLSFLGLGVEAPTPSWGIMVATGRANLLDAWWVATFPGLAIVAVVLAFNLAGDGLRDAFDPRRLRGGRR
jgi:peptide/nickel transport system permease protein